LIPNADATVRIDAKGMVVAPGFIDHSHGRRGIAAVPAAENYLRDSVTTFLERRVGSSAVPPGRFSTAFAKRPSR
jgi:N-acyl-D-aspartate/D-glutamate deacylase